MSKSSIAALVVGVAVLAGVVIFAVSGGADDGRKASIGEDVTQVSISDVTVTEGTSASASTLATFTITRSGDTTGTTQVSYVTADGSALAASDYTNTAYGSRSFGPGEKLKYVGVSIRADTVGEADEVFTLQFIDKEVTGALVADAVGKATIVNDDPALSVLDASVPESNSGTQQVAAKITRTGLTTGTAQVQWYTGTDGGASDGSDFVAASGSVTFNSGDTEKTALITVKGDTSYESDERIPVRLRSPSGAIIVDASGDVTIVNDDQPAQITTRVSINDVSVTEGNSASKMATFRISRSGDTTGRTDLIYYTSDGSALSSSDYTSANTPVSFNEGVAYRDVSIPIRGDTVGEADERFTVRLDKISEGAGIADGLGQATIVNDDPALSVLDARVTEGNTGTHQVSVKIARTGPTTGTAQAHWSTLDSTAKAGDDYVAASGTVTFDVDETEKTVLVTIKGDVWSEGDDKFSVRLSFPSGADILPASTYVTIINDDGSSNPAPR